MTTQPSMPAQAIQAQPQAADSGAGSGKPGTSNSSSLAAAGLITQAKKGARKGDEDKEASSPLKRRRLDVTLGPGAAEDDQENQQQEAPSSLCQQPWQPAQQQSQAQQQQHPSAHPAALVAGSGSSKLSSSIFSPIYHLVQQAHLNGLSLVQKVTERLTPLRNGLSGDTATAQPSMLSLGSWSQDAAAGVAAGDDTQAQLGALGGMASQQPEATLATTEQVEEEEDGEEEEEAFNPYLFISQLPPLCQCVGSAPRPTLLPRRTRTCKQKTLVLDLDETLVHSTLGEWRCTVSRPDFSFPVHFAGQEHMVHVRQRPHMMHFLEAVATRFEVVVFTASQKLYAEKLLNLLDPQRRLVRHRVYRDSCVVYDGNYLKDLSILGRDLAHTLIIDNSPQAFGFQLDNGVPIVSWYDDDADAELPALLPFLEAVADAEDVRPLIAARFRQRHHVIRAACEAGEGEGASPGSSSGATQQLLPPALLNGSTPSPDELQPLAVVDPAVA